MSDTATKVTNAEPTITTETKVVDAEPSTPTKGKNHDTMPSAKARSLVEKREEMLKSLDQESRNQVEKVEEIFSREDKSALQQRYELGCAIRDLRTQLSKQKGNTYGYDLIGKLCELYSWDKTTVYGSLAVVDAFTPEKIMDVCTRPLPSGRLIPFGHLRILARVKNKSSRKSLLEKTIQNGWTRADLDAEVLKHTGVKSDDDARGRPMKTPTDLPGLIRQQEQSVKQLLDRATQVWERPGYTISERVKQLSQTAVNAEQLQKLQHSANNLREAIAKLQRQLDETELAIENLEQMLATKKSEQSIDGTKDAVSPQAQKPAA